MTNVPNRMTLVHPAGIGEVNFTWQADRFQHVVVLGQARVETVQDDADTSWPKSPPLQDLSIEPIEGRDVALGVGRAGTSHWSVSVEPVEGGFRFEWACRTKQTPQYIGSGYRVSENAQVSVPTDCKLSRDGALADIEPVTELESTQTYRWSYTITG